MSIIAKRKVALRSPLVPLLNSAITWQDIVDVKGTVKMILFPIEQDIIATATASAVGGNYIAMTLPLLKIKIIAGRESFGKGNARLKAPVITVHGVVGALGDIVQQLPFHAQNPLNPHFIMSATSFSSEMFGPVKQVLTRLGPQKAQGFTNVIGSSATNLGKSTNDAGGSVPNIRVIETLAAHIGENVVVQILPTNPMTVAVVGYVSPVGTVASKLFKVTQDAQAPIVGPVSQLLKAVQRDVPHYTGGMVRAQEVFTGTVDGFHIFAVVPRITAEVIDNGGTAMTLFAPVEALVGWAGIVGGANELLFRPTISVSALRSLANGVVTFNIGQPIIKVAGYRKIVGTVAPVLSGVVQLVDDTVVDDVDMIPQGRLTLTSAVPFLTSDVVNATSIIYTPAVGNRIPIYNGTDFISTIFPEISQTLADTTKSPGAAGNNATLDLFVWNDAGTIRLSRGFAWASSTSRGTGVGTAELQFLNGIWTNKQQITNGPGPNLGTYVGTIHTDGSQHVHMNFKPAPAAGGSSNHLYLWNMYNRRQITSINRDSTTTWTYTTATWRAKNGNQNNSIDFVCGIAEDMYEAVNSMNFDTSAGAGSAIGIGFDSTSAPVDEVTIAGRGVQWGGVGSAKFEGHACINKDFVQIGLHFLQPLEIAVASGTGTWFGSSDTAGAGVGKFAYSEFTLSLPM